MRTSKLVRHRVRTWGMVAAALATTAVSGVTLSTALGSTPAAATTPTSCPAGSSLQMPVGGSTSQAQCVITSTGTPVGGVKHVWLIILENKSYDETFTGLNQNSYLWQTLPQQGALLTNYYGTGHFSMDNYISLVSGQSPSYAVQDDCSTTANMTNNNSGIITTGTVGTGHRHRRHHRRLRDQHHRAECHRPPATATTASSWCTVASTPRSATTAASTRPTSRPCSTSSTRPASPGRPTPRTSAAPSPSGRRPT